MVQHEDVEHPTHFWEANALDLQKQFDNFACSPQRECRRTRIEVRTFGNGLNSQFFNLRIVHSVL